MRSYKTEAIIVKRRNFGEADRVLTVLTKNYGKIQVRAPGVRRIVSRRSSHIELLNLSTLTLYRSFRTSMPIVTEAQAQEEFLPIKNTLKKIGFAYYICELVDRLCAENQENRRIFFLAKDTLFRLSNHQELGTYSSSDQASPGARRYLASPESREVWSLNSSRQDGYRTVTRQARTITSNSVIDDFEDELLVLLGFLPRQHRLSDKRAFIENILERKLSTKRLLPLFIY